MGDTVTLCGVLSVGGWVGIDKYTYIMVILISWSTLLTIHNCSQRMHHPAFLHSNAEQSTVGIRARSIINQHHTTTM